MLLDSPSPETIKGKRDRAILAALFCNALRLKSCVFFASVIWNNGAGYRTLRCEGKEGEERRSATFRSIPFPSG